MQPHQLIELRFNEKIMQVPFVVTFGEVPTNAPLILKDDYGRVEIAINMGNFANEYAVKVGDKINIKKLSA